VVVIGLDVHKDSIAAVAIDNAGRQLVALLSTIRRQAMLICRTGR
jgi:hypothetical protein